MRRLLVLMGVVALVAFACGDDDDAGGETTTTAEASAGSGVAGASPLVLAEVDFSAGVVVIRNTSSSSYQLSGHFLCNRPTYVEIPATTLAAGESVSVELSSLGVSADDGEIGLYTSRDFGSADAILRYVQWGTAEHGRTATAVEAGVWVAGDTVANNGASMVSSGDDPVSAADWTTV